MMDSKSLRCTGYGILLIALMCAGCAQPLKTFTAPDFDPAKPMRVAVLPFEVDKPSHAEAGRKIRRAFVAHLEESNLDVADIALVDRLLAERGWGDAGELRTIPPKELGETLGVDAVIFGEVTKWDKLYVVVHAHTSMAAHADMIDVRTGNRIWSAEKDAIQIKGILKAPIIIYMVPIPPTQFALEGFHADEMADELTRDMASPLVNAAQEGPSYASILERRPQPLSTEKALALQKDVFGAERHIASAKEVPVVEASQPGFPGEYAVQVCATRREAGARRLTDYLKDRGYPAYMTVADLSGFGKFHRVRIRGFAGKKEALAYGRDFSAKEHLPYWVGPVSSPLTMAQR